VAIGAIFSEEACMENLFFDNADNLWRIVISAPILYLSVIGFIRLSGKRSTSQMNNFDWIVTVAMGSLVASGIILKDVTILEIMLAIGLLLVFQYAVTKSLPHSKTMRVLIKAEPRLLVRDGKYLHDAMAKERVTEVEILAAIRTKGLRQLDDVLAVILETDASMSVLPTSDKQGDINTLENVAGWTTRQSGTQPDNTTPSTPGKLI
jgi:uncharacterized membrane protein YcaP (DUF421 family)